MRRGRIDVGLALAAAGLALLLVGSLLPWVDIYYLRGYGVGRTEHWSLWRISSGFDVVLAIVVAVAGALVPAVLRGCDRGARAGLLAALGGALATFAWLFSPLDFIEHGDHVRAGHYVSIVGGMAILVATPALARGLRDVRRCATATAVASAALALAATGTGFVVLARHLSLWQYSSVGDVLVQAAAAVLLVAAVRRPAGLPVVLMPAAATFIAVAALGNGLEPILAGEHLALASDPGAGAWLDLLLVAPLGLAAAAFGVRDVARTADPSGA